MKTSTAHFAVKEFGAIKAYPSRTLANKHGNGFTIFSVSLDKDPKAWKNAILTDGLSWENHVCVLNSNASYIQSYNISMIPTNFLIDGNGVILASNLRGKALDEKLASLKK